jgi:glycosyltransferase involved in cell wall biosynthesis
MAGLLVQVLEACGHEVQILSRLRSWEGDGSSQAQEKVYLKARQEVSKLVRHYGAAPPPDIIFTYHVYHKAPDWIGVSLARDLGVPYVIAEASTASKQIGGPWHAGYEQTMNCIRAARTIIAFNPVDIECLQPLLRPSQSIELLTPFLEEELQQTSEATQLRRKFSSQYGLDSGKVWLIAVAMMRDGDKSASYKFLAESLTGLEMDSWQLVVIGDGVAVDRVRNYFHEVASQCHFTGILEQQPIREWLAASDIFVWPAVNEAYGFAIIESLAAGLPAVVQDYGGVSTSVDHNQTGYVTDPATPVQFQRALASLISDGGARKSMGKKARNKFLSSHSFASARSGITEIFNKAGLTGQTITHR